MAKTAPAGTLTVHLTANADGLERGLKRGAKALKSFAGVALAAFGVNSLKNFAMESLNLFGIQEQNEQRLSRVLKATNHAAGLSAKQLKEHASELQGLTTVGDESILKLQTTLLAFTGVASDEFKRATALALDMSEVLGTGATENVKKLGKSLQDPLSALTGLKKAGVTFSEQQQAQIKSLVAADKRREAQLIILAELEKRYSGAAAAAADTVLGRQTQMANAWGDLKEGIGNVLAESLNLKGIYETLAAKFSEWAGWLNDNAAIIGFSFQSVFIDIQAGFQLVWASIKEVFSFIWEAIKYTAADALEHPFQTLWNGLKAVGAAVLDVADLVIGLAKEAWNAILGRDYDFGKVFANFGTEFSKVIDQTKPVVGVDFDYDLWGKLTGTFDEIDRDRRRKQQELEKNLLNRQTKKKADDNERGTGGNQQKTTIDIPPVAKLVTTAVQGSLEAYRARVNQGKNIPEKQLQIQQQQLNAQKETNRILKGKETGGTTLEVAAIGGV